MAGGQITRVEGLRQLGDAMRRLGADVAKKAARSATGSAAALVKKAAQDNIRKSPSIDSGSLLSAVIAKKLPNGQTPLTSEHIVTVRGRGKTFNKKGQKIARAPHAGFVEFGTVEMPAEPFLRPALSQNVRPAIDKMAQVLKRRIDKAGKA